MGDNFLYNFLNIKYKWVDKSRIIIIVVLGIKSLYYHEMYPHNVYKVEAEP